MRSINAHTKLASTLPARRQSLLAVLGLVSGLLLCPAVIAKAERSSDATSISTPPDTNSKASDSRQPSLSKSRYRPIPVTVLVNDASGYKVILRQRKTDGVLVASGTDIRQWGLAVGSSRSQRAKTDRWYSLQQFPKLTPRYDNDSRRLYIGSAGIRNTEPKNAAPIAALSNRLDKQKTNAKGARVNAAPTVPHIEEVNLSTTANKDVAATLSKESLARGRCPFLTDSVLNANQVNYQSLLLNVHVNGVDLKKSYQFIRRPCGPLLAPILEMRKWRIKVAGTPNVLIDDIHWLNLEEFDGIEYQINSESQEIFLAVKADKFTSIELDFSPQKSKATRSVYGAFLNYGFNASTTSGSSVSPVYSAIAEAGLFGPLGSLTSDWVVTRTNTNNVTRLNTTFVKDFPLRVQRLSLGDINGTPGAWGIGYRLGGIQFGTNFGTQPGMQISPVESVRILANEPVILRVNNRQTNPFSDEENNGGQYYNSQQALPYGPLEVHNLPTFSNGIYTLQGITADGSTIQQSQRYFFNQGLLKQGLHSYSVELGAIRQGGFSDRYNTPVFTATERYGFSKRLTGEARIEYGDDVVAYGVSLDTVIPWAGVLNATVA